MPFTDQNYHLSVMLLLILPIILTIIDANKTLADDFCFGFSVDTSNYGGMMWVFFEVTIHRKNS